VKDVLSAEISHSAHDDKVTLSHAQDVQPILDFNAQARDSFESQSRMGEMQHVARIPTVVAMQWMQEGINVMSPTDDDRKKIRQKLNSAEYQYLRTGGGRL
jgi:hypothetical protein